MRLVPTTLAVTVLTATFVVAPTMSSGAKPRPVAPTVHEVGIPGVAASGPAARTATPNGAAPNSVAPQGSSGTTGDPVVAATRVDGVDFDVAGVTFDRTPPAGTRVEVRTHDASGWSGWVTLDMEEDDAPDPGSADARRARPGTAPLAAAGSDAADIRVTTPDGSVPSGLRASLVDGGDSPADAALTPPPGSAVAAVTRPTFITRAQWGADESIRTCDGERLSGFKAVVVHHTVNSNTYSADQVPALIRSMYAFHVKSRGWCDLGYQVLVDRFGRAYEGRKGSLSAFVMGAQVGGFNADTTGVSVIGDFMSVPLSSAAASTVTKVAAWEADRSHFDPSTSVTLTSAGSSRYKAGVTVTKPRLMGHRDLSLTECPGDKAYAQVAGIRTNAGSIWRAGQWRTLSAQSARQVFAIPGSGSFALSGRGYGHGVGLSQWGAYGAATRGLTWQQIAAFYYPGTTAAAQGNPNVRVWLSALGTGSVRFAPQSGLVVSDGVRTAKLASAHWRVVVSGSTQTLQFLSGSTWVSSSTWRGSTRVFTFSRGATPIRTVLPSGTLRDYAGTIRTQPSAGRPLAVNVLPTETYLRSVVPSEMPAGWPAAALRSQAVAARSFVAYQRAGAATKAYDTCDSTCQVYNGTADYTAAGALKRTWSDTRSTAAVGATAGTVLTYGGKPALTHFSASNGGRTVAGSQPYLVARTDPYDGAVASSSNPSQWSTSVDTARLRSAYPGVGTPTYLTIVSRTGGGGTGTWGGRVASVVVSGTRGSVTVSGEAFRTAAGLRSTWWTVTTAPQRSASYSPRDVTGDRLPDAVIPSNGGLLALRYTGSLSFTPTTISTSATTGMKTVAAVGALDQDSLGDVVAVGTDGTAWLYPGLGSRGLDAGRRAIAHGWTDVNLVIGVGDWNGDGYTDVLTRTTSGELLLWAGNGTGALRSAGRVGTGWQTLAQITTGDFDGDGRVDLLGVRASDGALVLWSGTGTGSYRTGRVVDGSNWSTMTAVRGIGDVTGDGRDDIVARRASDGRMLVYRVVESAKLASPLSAGSLSFSGRWGQ